MQALIGCHELCTRQQRRRNDDSVSGIAGEVGIEPKRRRRMRRRSLAAGGWSTR